MGLRAVDKLDPADAITAANAALGFVAVVVAPTDPWLAARLILLAAIADALDGIVARRTGGSEVGPMLDSLADVASFGVAPAATVLAVSDGEFGPAGVILGAGFVAAAVLRLALYTTYDTAERATAGVQTTLAATILMSGLLAGAPPWTAVAGLGVLGVLMLGERRYPDLRARDAVIMGALQAAAIAAPTVFEAAFPRGLLVWALAYLLLAPAIYPVPEGKRS